MAITSSYLVAVSRLGEILEAVRKAQAPERCTTRFLADLGFKSTNDRLFVGVLKALGFVDASGVPQQRYFDYLDESESKRILADGIREAYEDLFRVNKSANTLSREQVKNKLKSLTQGQCSDTVLKNMSATFEELVKHADFNSVSASLGRAESDSEADENPEDDAHQESLADSRHEGAHSGSVSAPPQRSKSHTRRIDALSYGIEIILPTTRDRAVYDAIFRSLGDHLL